MHPVSDEFPVSIYPSYFPGQTDGKVGRESWKGNSSETEYPSLVAITLDGDIVSSFQWSSYDQPQTKDWAQTFVLLQFWDKKI